MRNGIPPSERGRGVKNGVEEAESALEAAGDIEHLMGGPYPPHHLGKGERLFLRGH